MATYTFYSLGDRFRLDLCNQAISTYYELLDSVKEWEGEVDKCTSAFSPGPMIGFIKPAEQVRTLATRCISAFRIFPAGKHPAFADRSEIQKWATDTESALSACAVAFGNHVSRSHNTLELCEIWDRVFFRGFSVFRSIVLQLDTMSNGRESLPYWGKKIEEALVSQYARFDDVNISVVAGRLVTELSEKGCSIVVPAQDL